MIKHHVLVIYKRLVLHMIVIENLMKSIILIVPVDHFEENIRYLENMITDLIQSVVIS